jgi:hypothetical protein
MRGDEMSSKREEKAAFERLVKAYPDSDSSLTCQYCSWHKKLPNYYVTVNNVGSTCGEVSDTADEAVDLMIKRKE